MSATFTTPFYILRDEFTTDLPAGSVDNTSEEPVQSVTYFLLDGLPWETDNGDMMVANE